MSPERGSARLDPRVWAALAAVYVIWGSTYLAIRVAIETTPPLLMAGFRFLVAGAVLYAIAIRQRPSERITPAHWRSALIVGAALLLGGNGAVVLAEQTVPSGIAALVIATTPLWMALLDRWIFGQRLGWGAVAGLLAGFGGVAVLAAPGAAGGFDAGGIALLGFAALCWASGSLYSRRAVLPRRPLVATAMEMLTGGACLAVAGLLVGEAGRVDLGRVSPASALAVAYLILVGSFVGFSAYIWLLTAAPVSLVGTYAYVNPVIAVALGWALLREPVTPRVLVAAAIIVAGVAMIVTTRGPLAPGEVEFGSPADAPSPPEEPVPAARRLQP